MRFDGKGGLAHREGIRQKHRSGEVGAARSAGPVLGSAMLREASWSRSNFSWGTFRCKRPNATLAASSGFDQPLMIALASSLLLELGTRLWQVGRQLVKNAQKIVIRSREEITHPSLLERFRPLRVSATSSSTCRKTRSAAIKPKWSLLPDTVIMPSGNSSPRMPLSRFSSFKRASAA